MYDDVLNAMFQTAPAVEEPFEAKRPGTRAHDLTHGPALSEEPAVGIARERLLVTLSMAASDWLLGLPLDVRPSCTAAWYPHVVNRLCEIWDDTALSSRYFSELLSADRQGRQGFEAMVLEELVELQRFGMTGDHR